MTSENRGRESNEPLELRSESYFLEITPTIPEGTKDHIPDAGKMVKAGTKERIAAREASKPIHGFTSFEVESGYNLGFSRGAQWQAERGLLRSIQNRVSVWMNKVFTRDIADSPRQRMQRFLEEAIEWFQAEGMTKDDALALVDYVYGRPTGRPKQEIGGVAVTMFAACARMGYDFGECFETEFERINQPDIILKIRRKQDSKNAAIGISDTNPPMPPLLGDLR